MMDENLFVAARTGDVEILRNLLPENVEEERALPESSKWTPLHIACLSGQVNFAREFLGQRPQFLEHENPDGCTALHLASSTGELQMVMMLLTFGRDDESMNREVCLKKDKDGRNPLHHAVIKGGVEVVTKLLAACPESSLDVTVQKETVFHLAVKNKVYVSAELFSELLGGPYTDYLLNLADKKGNTVLHLASVRKQSEIIRLLTERLPILDVNSVNSNGLTPLDLLVVDPMNVTDMKLEEMITSKRGIRLSDSLEQREHLKSIASWILVMASVTAAASCQIVVFLKGGFLENSSPAPGGNETSVSNSTNLWVYTSPTANVTSITSNITTAIQKSGNATVLDTQHGKIEPTSLPYMLMPPAAATFLLSICLIALVLFPTSTNKYNLYKWLGLRYLTYGSTLSLSFLFFQLVQTKENSKFQTIWFLSFLPFYLVIVILISFPLLKTFLSYYNIWMYVARIQRRIRRA